MKEKKKCVRKSILTLFSVIFITIMLPFIVVYAADIKVLETNVYNDEIYIYIRGLSEITPDSTVQIGNVICPEKQVSIADFEHMPSFMNTLILIDNSKSISEEKHADIEEILQGIISNSKENEQIKIGTFSKEITWLCDYTKDQIALGNIVHSITYQNQDTYLSDILYQVISELKAENIFLYTRIIVLSDGADDNFIGYTNEEVRRYIEKSQYPIYTVGILGKNNTTELETMFSFSRAAKTEYFLLDGTVSNEDIINTFLMDQKGVCVKITPDESVKDGSNKNILLRINTANGPFEITTNVEMPFGTGKEVVTEIETEKKEIETTLPSISPTQTSETIKPETNKNSPNFLWVFILFGVIIILFMVVIIILLLRKKKEPPKKEPVEENTEVKEEPKEEGTVMANGDEGETERGVQGLWENQSSQKYLVLTNVDNTDIFFKVPIVDVVRIGRRETQDIILDDKKVSREHCEIILRGDTMYIKDCKSANHTYYENAIVYEERPIVSGGHIKVGSYRYRIELVKE